MHSKYYIDVILPLPLEKLFTYSITEAESHFLKIGMRVAVPFGKTKVYTALVSKIHQTAPLVYEAKPIHQILDETPLVTSNQLQLWQWITKYYMCAMGHVMRSALPSAFILESETLIIQNKNYKVDTQELKDDEYLVYEALQRQSSLKIQDLIALLNTKKVLPVIQRLITKQIVVLQEEVFEKYKPKYVRYIKLNPQYNNQDALKSLLEDLARAPKQRQIVLSLFNLVAKSSKPIKASQLLKVSQGSSTQLKTLIEKQILESYHIQTDRIVYDKSTKPSDVVLNSYQDVALTAIKSAFNSKNVTLLHGVTSSGKTEVYVKLIQNILKTSTGQVLFLLPEIALTTQIVKRLQFYFGEQVAVFHSKYSVHERVEVWHKVLENSKKARIVIGARSALLLPFHKLELIIVDEEHEQSYKQFDPAPRYHARDAAIVLAQIHKAKVLLGSATPSVESYFNALQNKYTLVELNRRYNDVLLPEIQLVDIKDKHKRKLMKGHFSDVLISQIAETLNEGHQVILFQNRRGFSPIVECLTCGHSPQCPNCDVSLTYHQYRNQLRCHYCGYVMAMLQKCMACGDTEIDNKGFGTEQIEAEVKSLFPEVKVGRMDLDTTRGKYGYEKIITAFEQQEIDVLVGTQMITKGLDFRNVMLVGILNADNMLNFPDFRAHERSFQLMLQVSGRAGRTKKRGQVLIQTYNPHHNILQQLSTNDYKTMYKEQMEERYHYKYPPIYRLIKITLKHKDYNTVNTASNWYAKYLKQVFGHYVLGPEFPPVARIRNLYQKNILLKIPPKQSLAKTKASVLKINTSFNIIKTFKGVRVVLNVDNY